MRKRNQDEHDLSGAAGDARLERPAFLGRSFGEPQPYRPGALRGSGIMVLVCLLFLLGGLSELFKARYVSGAVLTGLALASGIAAFLLMRALLPAEVNRDPSEHLADFHRLSRWR